MSGVDDEIAELKTKLRELQKERRAQYQREYMREYKARPDVKLRRKLRDSGLSKVEIEAELARWRADQERAGK